ncbi:MAG: 2,5-dihydroxypyridine 5,6-dioxygenase [Methanobacteriota archaeon]|jgi:leucyl aminopeptidase (aminopeptidase T)|nr:MAG: 2,5-dihydroxypyridine 5,6-dioxygenase [Euryarchaeota archaeon]|tara:strand:+ start:679 stop:1818 length:1140 start_codon:yes stop_codon:yes gene_type:complete
MAPPFRRRSNDEEPKKENQEDYDLDEVVEAENLEGTKEKIVIVPEELNKEDFQEKMLESAKMVTHTCMDIRREENVLIVCDPTTGEIGQALHETARKRSDRVLLIVMPKGRHHGEEPPAPVANLMKQQQIVIAPTRYSLTHTRAIRSAIREGARVATMPGMSNEMFVNGGMTANFNEIKKNISNLSGVLRRKRLIHVKDKKGTDVEFEINWREWKLDDNGICNRPRMITNLPAGKAFIMPREGTMNGTIVIDGTWESTLLEEPLELTVENGIVIDIKGDSTAAQIRQQFGEAATRLRSKDRELVWTVAEFGFGMNPEARLTGHVLEDEKRQGTCYFSIGDNSSLGGNAIVGIHIPGVLSKPSVWLDDMQILDNGVFLSD